MLSEKDIELAHPEAFDFAFGNLPQDRRAEFNRHLSGCRYCQSVVDEYAGIGRIVKNLPPHAKPPADLEARTVAAMVAALAEQRAGAGRRPEAEDQAVTRQYPRPERHPPPEPETQVQPIPVPAAGRTRDGGPAITRRSTRTGRAAVPTSGHAPACVETLPWPPGCCRRRGRCAHRGRHRCPAQSRRGAAHPGPAHRRDSASCHHSGEGQRLRSSHRAGDGSSECLRQLGHHLDRASPKELRGCEVVPVLVRQPTAWPSGLGWYVPRPR